MFLAVAVIALYFALVPSCVGDTSVHPYADNVLVKFGKTEFVCEVANTPELSALGLSGREALLSGRGMLFDTRAEPDAIFWMKGMRFPIDIVWVGPNLVVVHVDRDVPIVDSGIPDSAIPLYHWEGSLVRYVVELNAGTATEHGIVTGTEVTIQNGISFDGGSR